MGEIQQHFPEVVLFVGKGLPSELGLLWRPSRSLGSFDDKKEEVSETRNHRIFRVRDGETWFAIKEYHIREVSDMRTCFKGYKHGSVDKWVCGHQRPGWVKVRSVHLDALISLAHLHENGILHGDVKPPNILVDDRERGRF
jgi:hypothetical protein